MDLLNTLTVEDVGALFGKKHVENVKANWPMVSAALRTAGWADDEVLVAYALATIRAETSDFTPRGERAHAGVRSADGRDFGAYDAVAITQGGKPSVRFYPDKSLRLTASGLGNRPYVKGSWLDPNVSGENRWRELKGLAPRTVEEAGDGTAFRGRGYVQLTGRANYAAAAKDLGLDLLADPDLAGVPDHAARILVWYLKGRAARIRASLGGSTRNYLEARAAVNGKNKDGTVNGLGHFTTAYDAALATIQSTRKKAGAAPAKATAPQPMP